MDIKFHKRSGVISIQRLRVDREIRHGYGSVATLHGDRARPGTLKPPPGVIARLRPLPGRAAKQESRMDANMDANICIADASHQRSGRVSCVWKGRTDVDRKHLCLTV